MNCGHVTHTSAPNGQRSLRSDSAIRQPDISFVNREPISDTGNMRPRRVKHLGGIVAESDMVCRQP